MGPAKVLFNEKPNAGSSSSSHEQNTKVVWLTHGGKLIRAAPEQLRPASSLEKFCHEVGYPGAVFREYNDIRKDLKRGQWTDITGQTPDEVNIEDTPHRGGFARPADPTCKRSRDSEASEEPSKREKAVPVVAKRSQSEAAPTRRMRAKGPGPVPMTTICLLAGASASMRVTSCRRSWK